MPNWFKLAEDVALYRSLNVSGMFMEGETGVSTPDLHEMRVWMLARLYFSPTASGPALMREFLDSFCKMAMLSRFVALSVSLNLERITIADSPKATPFLMAHMKVYRDAVDAADWHVTASDNVFAPEFAPKVTLASLAHIDAAASAAAEDNTSAAAVTRINKLRLSPWWVTSFVMISICRFRCC